MKDRILLRSLYSLAMTLWHGLLMGERMGMKCRHMAKAVGSGCLCGTVVVSFYHQDGNAGRMENTFGHASHQQPADSGAAMRGNQ
jgi:hydroxyethylthiazole kinase-like sugar kinase family protein